MKLGIVGHDSKKFTRKTERLAKLAILDAVKKHNPVAIVSGRCPNGGVDIYAEQAAAHIGLEMVVHEPDVNQWNPPDKYGFMARNMDIAKSSDVIVCIVVEKMPTDYKGSPLPDCYHCQDRNPPHVVSGGCWTAWRCRAQEWVIV